MLKELFLFLLTFIASTVMFVATVLTLQFSTSIVLKIIMLMGLFLTAYFTIRTQMKQGLK